METMLIITALSTRIISLCMLFKMGDVYNGLLIVPAHLADVCDE
jgi:hypothetical protein